MRQILSPASLQLRLIVGAAVAVIVAMIVSAFVIANLYHAHADQRFKSELDHHLDELVLMIGQDERGLPVVRQSLSDPLFALPESGLYWQIDGESIRLRSPSLGTDRLSLRQADGRWTEHFSLGDDLFQRSVRIDNDGRPIIVTMAAARRLLDEQILHFHDELALGIIALGALLLAGAVALVRFGLSPVRRLGEEVDRLRRGEVERLSTQVPAEFVALVDRLNAVLDGQAQLIARARTGSGNLAHHLRTPLALIADEAEQLKLAGHSLSGDFLLTHCDAMQRHIDYHMVRAAAAGLHGSGRATPVRPLVENIIEAMKRLYAPRNLRFDIDVCPDTHLRCEEADLAEILSNLIDNASKWATTRVFVAAAEGRIDIGDDGPGIPPAQREMALSIGRQLEPGRGGAGLGLAASCQLLAFYEGRLELGETKEGGLLASCVFE